MKTGIEMGLNRTGIGTSPLAAKASIQGAEEGVPLAGIDGSGMARVRADYVRDAEPIGTVPPPTSVKGAVLSAGQLLSGKRPAVLLDKLSERLAFERTGTRLYVALIAKMEAMPATEKLPLEEVRRFHDEERAHMQLVAAASERLGGDQNAERPSADVDGVASMGLLQVIADPRTSILHSLHAIHIAELADNDGWLLLIQLAGSMGQDEMVTAFSAALDEEEEHLESVRRWMTNGVLAEAQREAATFEPGEAHAT